MALPVIGGNRVRKDGSVLLLPDSQGHEKLEREF